MTVDTEHSGLKTPSERSPDLPEDVPQRPIEEPAPHVVPDDIPEPDPDVPDVQPVQDPPAR